MTLSRPMLRALLSGIVRSAYHAMPDCDGQRQLIQARLVPIPIGLPFCQGNALQPT